MTSNVTREQFEGMVKTAKEYIAAGDIYQVVLSQRFEAAIDADPFTVYRALRHVNPSPYMYFLRVGDRSIVGSSPEMLVRVEGRQVQTHPIAGTRPRGRTEDEDVRLGEELKRNEKERAEHVMLVDLGRNDIGRVAKYGTVRVPTYMTLERYSHVMHLVSIVEGRLDDAHDRLDALVACFPAGTVSGAPKVRAMEIIAELENRRRGVYAGAVGYLDFAGNLDFCITIRTVLIENGRAYVQAGAGIVADSNPTAEYEETRDKARAVLRALELAQNGFRRARLQPRLGGLKARLRGNAGLDMVLVIDNYDSFTYNLVQYLGELGAEVRVRRNDQVGLDEVAEMTPEHIVISPGPGRPEDAGVSMDVIRRFGPTTPVLGVCLGHQAIGMVYGGIVTRGHRADARQDLHRRARRQGHLRRRRLAVPGRALSLAGRVRRRLSRAAAGVGAHEGGPHHHGRAPRLLPGARRAVPSRVGADRRGPAHPAQLPGPVSGRMTRARAPCRSSRSSRRSSATRT